MKYVLIVLGLGFMYSGHAQKVDMSIFEKMQMRQIGPAGMSGRVTCIDVVHSSPNTIYIGSASGGVWKSTSGGTGWKAIGDTMPTLNIGALAIQQSNPSVIWVGTGEGNPRNSQSSGYGVFRSLDAGRTWSLMGLEETRNIHRIIVHPNDPNTIWVGAQGPAWGDNPNRGVYKTTNGGKTWNLVLKGDESSGIGDLVIDPSNPNKLIASLWDFRRDPWFFRSGGKGSGLYISFDGGETWVKRTYEDGLPKGELGRIGIAIAPSDPNRVYALVEAKENDVYRSDDGGFKWYKISSDKNAGDRPFYYSDLFVDPVNENRIYSLWSRVSQSEDGGKTWKVIIPYYGVHPDHHAFWVHPKDPGYIIIGNDGGMAISRDRAETWRFVKNLPLAQFYHINVDNEMPYNIYGGMQDNGSWRGPAYVWAAGGIRNAYFQEVMFGDGFDVVPDPTEPNRYGYAMSQEGNLGQYDLLTGYRKDIQPTTGGDVELRFNWNAPIAQDPFDVNMIYYGSQFVHKSTQKGNGWEFISEDLTTNDTTKQKQKNSGGLTLDVTGAENYTTLTVIEPSPIQKDLIWTGSDDGRIHVTHDGGKHWVSLEKNIKEMPEGAWVNQIHASKHNAEVAFVVVNDYRRNNWNPYLFRTTNGGKSWKRIASESNFKGYCLSVMQDPQVPELLFVGTEHGLYVSFDDGVNWNHWKHGFPNVSTTDIKIQERENDLVVATFGRAAYILDDITPLRELAKSTISGWKEKQLVLFDIPTTYQVSYTQAPGVRFGADDTWEGENRTSAARVQLYYHRKEEEKDKKTTEGKLRVFNAAGDTIRTFKIELSEGLNRVHWGKDQKRERSADAKKPEKDTEEPGGFPVLPGIYTIEVECDSVKVSGLVRVEADPRMSLSQNDLLVRQERFEKAEELTKRLTEVCDELRANQAAIKRVNELMPEEKDDNLKNLMKLGGKMNDTIQGMLDAILGKENLKGIQRNSEELNSKVQRVLWEVWGSLYDNPQRFEHMYTRATEAFEKSNTDIQHFLKNEWLGYKNKVDEIDFDPFRN